MEDEKDVKRAAWHLDVSQLSDGDLAYLKRRMEEAEGRLAEVQQYMRVLRHGDPLVVKRGGRPGKDSTA